MTRAWLASLSFGILTLAGLGACPPTDEPLPGTLGRARFKVEGYGVPCIASSAHALVRVFYDGDYRVTTSLPEVATAERDPEGAMVSTRKAGRVDLRLLDDNSEVIDEFGLCVVAADTITVDSKTLAGGPRILAGNAARFAVERSAIEGRLAGRGGYTLRPSAGISAHMVELDSRDLVELTSDGSDGTVDVMSGNALLHLTVTGVVPEELTSLEMSIVTCYSEGSSHGRQCGLSLRAATRDGAVFRPGCDFQVAPAGLQIIDNQDQLGESPDGWFAISGEPGTYEVTCKLGSFERKSTLTLD